MKGSTFEARSSCGRALAGSRSQSATIRTRARTGATWRSDDMDETEWTSANSPPVAESRKLREALRFLFAAPIVLVQGSRAVDRRIDADAGADRAADRNGLAGKDETAREFGAASRSD